MESQVLLDNFGDARQIAVERALAEFRAARPVAIESGDAITLAFPAEGLTEALMPFFQDTKRSARLTLPWEKVRPACLSKGAAVTARLHPLTLATIEHIAGYSHAHVAADGAPAYTIAFEEPDEAEAAALALANLSLLSPAVIVM